MKIKNALTTASTNPGGHTFYRRLIVPSLAAIVLLAGVASGAQAASCWGYYVDEFNGGQVWVWGFESEESARDAARRSLIGWPGLRVHYIGNRCTGKYYQYDGNGGGGGGGGRPTQEYINQIAQVYNRAKQLKEWAQQNIGRLTERNFNIVNQAINDYNSKITQAKRDYYSTFSSSSTMRPIPASYKQQMTYYTVVYRARGTRNWRWLTAKTDDYNRARRWAAYLNRKYGRTHQFYVVKSR